MVRLAAISRRLSLAVSRLEFGPPVALVYDPATYARISHEAYLERARAGIEALFVGMNPGPFGMVQTGVPFGEVAAVRDFLGIEAPVERPTHEHPRRRIEGFDCRRSEVSGRRFWGFMRAWCGSAEAFFERFFVWNYCPLAFLESTGRNRTPNQLAPHERAELFAACDRALVAMVRELRPRQVVAIGVFARERAAAALGTPVGLLLHPSPASPLANRGWEERAEADLERLGIRPTAVAGAARSGGPRRRGASGGALRRRPRSP